MTVGRIHGEPRRDRSPHSIYGGSDSTQDALLGDAKDMDDAAYALHVRQGLDPDTASRAAFEPYEKQQREADAAEAKRLGIEPRFIEAGRQFGEDAEELAALDGLTGAAEVEKAMADLAARREAREQAEHQARVAAEAKKL